MIILDTDHFTILKYGDSEAARNLSLNMAVSVDQDFATTAISLEEQMRGLLALLNRSGTEVDRQLPAYRRLVELVQFFSNWRIMHFDDAAAAEFKRLRKLGLRIGTMDLKIAAIALALGATVVTANLKDFELVPELKIENWLV